MFPRNRGEPLHILNNGTPNHFVITVDFAAPFAQNPNKSAKTLKRVFPVP
jgi:hypothetical protein